MTLQQITFIGSYTYTPVDLRSALHKLHSGALVDLAWIERRRASLSGIVGGRLRGGENCADRLTCNLQSIHSFAINLI